MYVVSALVRSTVRIHLVAALIFTALIPWPAFANEALKWNEVTVKAAIAGGQNPIQQTRTVAMVQAAVHDALNAIKPRYAAYYFEGPASDGALADAAIAAASQTVLTAVIPAFGGPSQRTEALALVEEAYRAALAGSPEGQAKQDGIAAGRAAGEAMLALGKEDGATRSNALHTLIWSRTLAAASEPRST